MRVKPKAGLQVRDPVTREPLPADGAEVPEDAYWMRRLANGDVVLVKPAAPQVQPAPPKKEA